MDRRIGILVVMAGREAGGPETYEHNLVRALAALDEHNEYHILGFSEAALDSFGVHRENVHYHRLAGGVRAMQMSLGLSHTARRQRLDLLHAAFIAPPFRPVDYVFTLHCSSPFMHPEMYPPLIRWRLKFLIQRGMRQARHIMCVSRNVLDLAREYYGIPEERMSVVYNGISEHFRPVPALERADFLASLGLEEPYFLFAGRFEPRKNVPRILRAFHRFHHEVDATPRLVLAGNSTWDGDRVEETLEKLALGDAVMRLGTHIDNERMPALYSGAMALIYPSLWEGFGLPVIEAMACGTPVLTSNLSSLPEVAGDAALLVDPTDVDEIAHGMERLATDDALRNGLIAKGLARAAAFSWRNTARQVLDVYQRFGR